MNGVLLHKILGKFLRANRNIQHLNLCALFNFFYKNLDNRLLDCGSYPFLDLGLSSNLVINHQNNIFKRLFYFIWFEILLNKTTLMTIEGNFWLLEWGSYHDPITGLVWFGLQCLSLISNEADSKKVHLTLNRVQSLYLGMNNLGNRRYYTRPYSWSLSTQIESRIRHPWVLLQLFRYIYT